MLELSIIILNYNTADLTVNCINSINDQYKKELEEEKFEIVVVDNNSIDDSLEKLQKMKVKNLRIVKSDENLGFSKGCNLGAKNAEGENFLFLNSDTEIKDQGFNKMVSFLKENEKIGILGGKLKNIDGTNQLSAGKFYNVFYLFLMLIGSNKLLRESPDEIKRVNWVSGASLMIKKTLFQKLEGFDKEIFMYVEDMELCYRALKKGFFTYFYPQIMLFHKELGSGSRTFAILNIYKGVLLFFRKHKSKLEYLLALLLLKTKAAVLVVLGKIINNKYLLETYSQALKI